jgi:hypothetical protein
MNNITHFRTFLFLLVGFVGNAQDLVWTGSALTNDFFDEGNWKNPTNNIVSGANTINPGQAINLQLQINNVTAVINAAGTINLGIGSLNIGLANLNVDSVSGGTITMNNEGYLDLSGVSPFQNNVQFNFVSDVGWVRTINYSTNAVFNNNIGQIKVNNIAATYKNNLRIDNYYLNGAVIRSNEATTSPLIVYDGTNLQGASASILVNTIQSGNAITNSMNDKMKSFVLKKGFMVTIANEADGTGKSKNYIASESDLVINQLPKALLNAVSFIRVIPWNWATKKGRTDIGSDLNTTWRYRWNNTENSNLDWEYAPMSWGWSAAQNSTIPTYVAKYNSTHVMGFNEADNCNDQSGQYTTGYNGLKLCDTDAAVFYYKNLMKTGMRLVSPACREEGATGWLKTFYDKATTQDIRIDVIGVHWYDWGGNPSGTPNADPVTIFNRFKTYLTNVRNLYGLPIWITEFNANPNRTTSVNLEFMKLALPYLETLNYVERYNWYQPNSGVANFYTSGTTLSNVGITYRDQISMPSIAVATVNAANNLSIDEYPNIAVNKPATGSTSYLSFGQSGAVDGDSLTTAWYANIGVTSGSNYSPLPAWIEVDLQGSFTIDSFRLIEATKAAKSFTFQVWDPTLAVGAGGWASVVNVTGNPATPLSTYKSFSPVTTTKVRLYITEHNDLNYIRLLELEVYGVPSAALAVQQNNKKQAFTIYPNPVSNRILNIIGEEVIDSVSVCNLLGAHINAPFQNGQLMVDGLSVGIYFLKINNQYTYKFIKK